MSDPAIVTPFYRIFRNFITQHFLWIYIIFHILTQQKNPRNPYRLRSIKNSAHAHKVFLGLGFWVFGHRWSVGLIKSKKVKVKSFYNYLSHHLPAITEFSIFWATLLYRSFHYKYSVKHARRMNSTLHFLVGFLRFHYLNKP